MFPALSPFCSLSLPHSSSLSPSLFISPSPSYSFFLRLLFLLNLLILIALGCLIFFNFISLYIKDGCCSDEREKWGRVLKQYLFILIFNTTLPGWMKAWILTNCSTAVKCPTINCIVDTETSVWLSQKKPRWQMGSYYEALNVKKNIKWTKW